MPSIRSRRWATSAAARENGVRGLIGGRDMAGSTLRISRARSSARPELRGGAYGLTTRAFVAGIRTRSAAESGITSLRLSETGDGGGRHVAAWSLSTAAVTTVVRTGLRRSHSSTAVATKLGHPILSSRQYRSRHEPTVSWLVSGLSSVSTQRRGFRMKSTGGDMAKCETKCRGEASTRQMRTSIIQHVTKISGPNAKTSERNLSSSEIHSFFFFCFQRMMRLESSRRGGAAGFSLPMPPVHHSRPRKSSTLKANV